LSLENNRPISYSIKSKDEAPNQTLARQIAVNDDTHSVKELVENLYNKKRHSKQL